MDQETISIERLRKLVPILPIIAVVILFVSFFLPKSAASMMQVNTVNRQKVYECCISKSGISGAGMNLMPDEQDKFLDLLSKVRLVKAVDTNGNGFPTIDYIITITKSSGAVVSAAIRTEGYFSLDGETYQMLNGSGEGLIQFLQSLPFTD